MNSKRNIIRLIAASTFPLTFCSTIIAQTKQYDVRPDVQNIVSALKKESTLHLGAPVGFAGIPETKNKYYKLYQKLSTEATDEELVSLTSDNSKTIVLYS